jgi:hypothetical protein
MAVTKLTTGDAEEDYLLGFDALKPGRYSPTFRRNTLISSRRLRQANNQQEATIANCCGWLLGLLFDPDDGGSMFFRNVG